MKIKKYLKAILCITLSVVAQNSIAQEKPISLSEAKTMALENNKRIKIAQRNVDAAQAARSSAYAADKPMVDASATGLYLSAPFNALLPEYSANGSVAVTQVLYAGGKIKNAKKLTESALEFHNAQKSLTEDEVLLAAETAYWQVVSLKEKIILANEYIKLLNALNTDLKNSYEAGLTYKNDLLKVEVQQNEAALNLTKAKDGLTITKLSLAQIIGLEDINFDVKDDSNEVSLVGEADLNSAIEKRPEIAMLNKAVEMQEFQGKILQGDRRPTVALSANGIAGFGQNINFSNQGDDMQAFVGLVTVNIPILDWGGRKNKVKEQRFKTEAQKTELEETKGLLAIEIQSVRLGLSQSVQKIALTERSLQQAKENLRLNQDRFDAGTVLGEDVLEAQALWQKAYADTIDARAEYMVNEAKYKKAIGEY